MNRHLKTVLIVLASLIAVSTISGALAAQGVPPATEPLPPLVQTPFGPAIPNPPPNPFGPGPGTPVGPAPAPFGAPPTPPQAPTAPQVVTPFGNVPNPPLPPIAPTPPVPQSAPDDLSELQRCYKALSDPQTCQLLVAEQAKWEVRFFELKYANPYNVSEALRIFRASINVPPNLRLLSVKAPKEIMPAVEDAVKRLDVPPAPTKSVELTLYVLSASDQSASEPTAGGSVPQAVQPVVNQLRSVFSYKQFRLVDTLVLTGIDMQTVHSSGNLPPGVFSKPGVTIAYSFETRVNLQRPNQTDAVVRLEAFRFSLQPPAFTSIQTVVEAPPGKQVVIGKATVGESALILVLSAKII